MKRLELLAPLLFAYTAVLFFYATNEMTQQPLHVLVVPLWVATLIAACCFCVAYACTRNDQKSAVLATAMVIANFLPAVGMLIVVLLAQKQATQGLIDAAAFGLPIIFLLAAVFAVEKLNGEKWLGKIAAVGLFGLVVEVFSIAVFWVQTYSMQMPKIQFSDTEVQSGAVALRPDVYFIVLDGYANPETAVHDPRLLQRLNLQGFRLYRDSFSNYPMTLLSLSATLNMDYLDPVERAVGRNSDSLTPAVVLIERNRVCRTFRKLGYSVVNVAGRFGPSAYIQSADSNRASGVLDMFSYELAQYTLLGLIDSKTFRFLAHYYADSQAKQLDLLLSASAEHSPKFVFCHLLSPHPPFVVSADGKLTNAPISFSWGEPTRQSESLYVNQMSWTGGLVSAAVAGILRNYKDAAVKPVIIIQSDHGASFLPAAGESQDQYMYHRHRNLNAIYMPEEWRNQLTEPVSPVNNFRFLFSKIAKCDLPLLPNRAFFATYSRPWDQKEITNLFSSTNKLPAPTQ